MELKIKFSQEYLKLPCAMPFKATLLQCVKTHFNDLSEIFKEYDTCYFSQREFNETKNYQLPRTELIILILQFGEYIFTTIRRYTPKKWEYYLNNTGKEFKIIKI